MTQNQTLALELRDKPAGEILVEILRRANPDRTATGPADPRQKLVYVVEPRQRRRMSGRRPDYRHDARGGQGERGRVAGGFWRGGRVIGYTWGRGQGCRLTARAERGPWKVNRHRRCLLADR